ncbi:hypothetical protein VTJ04DRAFT_1719 [Mycothermus thermophilus]|uniref:uncharacterized protein n=1 Tax=Humicola insolens TaxID=85995 RepID=UPI003743582F
MQRARTLANPRQSRAQRRTACPKLPPLYLHPTANHSAPNFPPFLLFLSLTSPFPYLLPSSPPSPGLLAPADLCRHHVEYHCTVHNPPRPCCVVSTTGPFNSTCARLNLRRQRCPDLLLPPPSSQLSPSLGAPRLPEENTARRVASP